MTKLQDYKGYTILVLDDGLFQAEKNDQAIATAETLVLLKKTIDKFSKAKMGQKAMILESGYGDRVNIHQDVKVSSVKIERNYRGDQKGYSYRVTYKDGNTTSWKDLPASSIFKPTDANKQKAREMAEALRQREELWEKYQGLRDSLEHYTDQELLGE